MSLLMLIVNGITARQYGYHGLATVNGSRIMSFIMPRVAFTTRTVMVAFTVLNGIWSYGAQALLPYSTRRC